MRGKNERGSTYICINIQINTVIHRGGVLQNIILCILYVSAVRSTNARQDDTHARQKLSGRRCVS